MAASFLVIAANLWMLYRATRDQQQFKLTAEQMMLFARLPGLSPGQFKQLLDLAIWQEPKEPLRLTIEGQRPDTLHYVLEGTVEVKKSGKVFALGPHAFVGELAFLREKPATATVTAKPGALLVSWKSTALRQLFKGHPAIEKVLSAILSADMAEKIAKADVPLLQEQSAGR
jgi:CRP-like cAMP-binding protein